MRDITKEIEDLIQSNEVVLFMKGNKDFPQCGFSATTAHILGNLLSLNFKDVDILKDAEMRSGIKEFSDWPTIPQLYIKGEFIGGCDIVKEMFESGELQELLKK